MTALRFRHIKILIEGLKSMEIFIENCGKIVMIILKYQD